jgi:prepilin-type N-terminal cleavage/methylation domain-containing protein
VAFWRRGKIRGFTFVELMLAVAILSIGIVAVMQAFSFSLKMTGLSADISSAALLAGDITEEARFKVKHNLIALSPATVEGESGKFKWNYIFEPQEEEKLYLFKLGLSWRSSGQEEAFNLVTYFKK